MKIPDSQNSFNLPLKTHHSWDDEHLTSFEVQSCCVVDFQSVKQMVALWETHLPRVEMFHKVKSNNNVRLLADLAELGLQFQLTSKKDFSALESAGLCPSSSVLISPAKMNSLLREAEKQSVPLLSFDCENELVKIRKTHPDAQLLLDVSSFQFPQAIDSCQSLLERTALLGMKVAGVCLDETSLGDVELLKAELFKCVKVAKIAKLFGHELKILHLGAIIYEELQLFEAFSAELSTLLDDHFANYRIMANTTEFHLGEPLAILTPVLSTEAVPDQGVQVQLNTKLNSFNAEHLPTIVTSKRNQR
ncbi:Oidioi.mRNA.OKI2018_I69.XSR.g14000.t1.cds [Oikopleura dioica]|uniref:Oidioi.mRNA.OKI2018_I69.XSR.g14000.t1.cds n=1 Tax=Oikopleura dioica TaxID=34765 RepID=A0ABN7SET3_OIKDI|nr:Oidioi.mRNA.OKI2018_I69.XSR.g14000.t1.cds [Oikopleura dioica]